MLTVYAISVLRGVFIPIVLNYGLFILQFLLFMVANYNMMKKLK